jgi:hypothetical protein
MSVRNLGTVEITASCIIKKYTCNDAEARVLRLQSIYTLLKNRDVPNTDHILNVTNNIVYLAPRGIPVTPKIQMELRECVLCVLQTLVVCVVNWFVVYGTQTLLKGAS